MFFTSNVLRILHDLNDSADAKISKKGFLDNRNHTQSTLLTQQEGTYRVLIEEMSVTVFDLIDSLILRIQLQLWCIWCISLHRSEIMSVQENPCQRSKTFRMSL